MRLRRLTLAVATLVLGVPAWATQELVPADPGKTFLETRDPLQRERARRILIGRGAESLPILQAALSTDDPRVREGAIFALTESRHEEVDAWLDRALADPDRSVQIAAMRTLAIRGPEELHSSALELAQSTDWALRRGAALLLGRTCDEEAISALARLLKDPDPDVSAAALRGLLTSEERSAAEFLKDAFRDLPGEHQEQVLLRLSRRPDRRDALFLKGVLRENDDDRLRILAAATLARLEQAPPEPATWELIRRCVASGDPALRNPGISTLLADREGSGRRIFAALRAAEGTEAETFAGLLVGLLGKDAYAPLLELAQGAGGIPGAPRAAAVHALRRFNTPATTTDLLWIYSPDLPRDLREEICSAFEDLPRSDSARSGLVDLLEDPSSHLRLRAFRVLLRFGATTTQEIDWLWQRLLEEKDPRVRRSMSQLLATHAKGEGARAFAEQMVVLLDGPEPFCSDARAALENLQDPVLSRRAANLFLATERPTLDFDALRLLTRLSGETADERVAREFLSALQRADNDLVLKLLIALRTGGGARALAAVASALDASEPLLAIEALRTLLTRGDAAGLAALQQMYDDLPGEERMEFLSLVRSETPELLASALRSLLAREQDDLVKEAIVTRAGELRLPMAEALAELLSGEISPRLLIRTCDALAGIGGEVAVTALRRLYLEERAAAFVEASLAPDHRLMLESLARAVALTGQTDLAGGMASLLFTRVAEMERKLYLTDASFPFEVTVLQALLDLSRSSEQPLEVAAAVEVELQRAAESGALFLLPKALFGRLARALERAPEAFDPLRSELLHLALALPPHGDRKELWVTTRLADLATRELDHDRAALLLEKAQLLIRYYGVDHAKEIRECLDAPEPLAGFDPLLRLDARIEMARARARSVMGADDAARQRYAAAARIAPFDSWLRLQLSAELMEQDLDREGARRHAWKAMALNPHDPDLLVRAARILAWAGDAEGFEAARAAHAGLRDAGLARDTVKDRLGLAESWVLLGREDEARGEIEAAVGLDQGAVERVRINPLLGPVFGGG